MEELMNDFRKLNDELTTIEEEYNNLLSKKEENEKKLESNELSSIDKEYAKGIIEEMTSRFEQLNFRRNELLNEIKEKQDKIELEKEKQKIGNNTEEENQRFLEKINKEITIAEKNSKEINDEIKYYQTRMERENFEPQKHQQMQENIKILEEKYKKEITIIGDLKLKLDRTKSLINKKENNNDLSITNISKESPSSLVDNDYGMDTIPEGKRIMINPTPDFEPSPLVDNDYDMDTIPEGKRIMINPTPNFIPAEKSTPVSETIPTDDSNPPIEVVGIEKKPNFFSKHKKAILIAAGLATLSTVLVPPLAAAMMYGNSVLWGAVSGLPAISGMAQTALHAANIVLSPLAGAAGTFNATAGTWALSSGLIFNSGAAAAGIGATITAAIVNGGITIAAVSGFKKLAKKLKESFKKMETKKKGKVVPKEKISEKPNITTDTPISTPVEPKAPNEVDSKKYYELLGINPADRDTITKEQINANLIKMNSEILTSKDKNTKVKLQKLLEAYDVLSNPETKKAYDQSLDSMNLGESKGGMVK